MANKKAESLYLVDVYALNVVSVSPNKQMLGRGCVINNLAIVCLSQTGRTEVALLRIL